MPWCTSFYDVGHDRLLDLEKDDYAGTLLPANQFKTGDLVSIKPHGKDSSKDREFNYQLIRAVVSRLSETRITVSLDMEPGEEIMEGRMRVTL